MIFFDNTLFPANDNDDDGDEEMNRVEAGGDAQEQQEEVPLVCQESSVKLVFSRLGQILFRLTGADYRD